MKKVYLLFTAFILGSVAFAQITPVTPAVKEEKKKTVEAKKEHNPHDGHDHTGHNHGTPVATPAVQNVSPVVEMAKPVQEDNLAMTEAGFDFGKIPQGKPVTHDFTIANSGKTELKLDNVQASCGCTTPVWKQGPYKPGEKASITVGYNAAAPGPFNKTVTITYNGGLTKVINITGEVWQAPATPAPENKSVQILKNGN
jgi:Protein of unknown function (DUF1573)